MAEARITELKEQLRNRASNSRTAERVECARCQEHQEKYDHNEAYHNRHTKYISRQLETYKDKVTSMEAVHDQALLELRDSHTKELALRQNRYDKKITALEYKLDVFKLQKDSMEKENREAATAASIASREAAKELAIARTLEERRVREIQQLEAEVDKLNAKVDEQSEIIAEIDRECEMPDVESEESETAEDPDDEEPCTAKTACCLLRKPHRQHTQPN